MNPVNVGGEFGGKGDGVDLPLLYFLAQKTGRPVKVVMTYAEELSASNPAHPTVITIKSGVMRDGRIVARKMRAAHASGGYGALKSNSSLATWHYAGGQYRIDNTDIEYLADLHQYRAGRLLSQPRRGGDGVRGGLSYRYPCQGTRDGPGRVSLEKLS